MRGRNESKALPIDWKEQYATDKIEEVPSYAWVRGIAYTYTKTSGCLFNSTKEWVDHMEDTNAVIIQDDFCDYGMTKGLPKMIEVDSSTIQEIKDEYIICSAIWYKTEEESERGFVAQNLNKGIVIGQWRHPNVIHAWKQASGNRTVSSEVDYVNGFISSEGNFYDREQAMCVAFNAGQVSATRAFRMNNKNVEPIKSKDLLSQEPQRMRDIHTQYRVLYSEDLY